MQKIKTALISVSDKNGITEFANDLSGLGIQILSTGGTAKLLKENGIKVTEVSKHTGFPEILDGRVKTLHPKIHGGILAVKDNKNHLDQMKKHGIEGIDLVVVNLYPFKNTTQKIGVNMEEVIENIDIGGPSMIRSAAKNYKFTAVVVDSRHYSSIINELKSNNNTLSETLRFQLAVEAFKQTYQYDQIIFEYFEKLMGADSSKQGENNRGIDLDKKTLSLELEKNLSLRYGENPHQKASFYVEKALDVPCVGNAEILNGKELSFNNIIDLNAAWEIVSEFEEPSAVVIKHTNPCGASSADTLSNAFLNAYNGDPVSAFGCILGFNKTVDTATAEKITYPGHFVEAIIAPDYEKEALNILTTKRKWGTNLRVLKTGGILDICNGKPSFDMKKVLGGLLVQERDITVYNENELKTVTDKKSSGKIMADLKFAFTICKHVKSNSIVLVKDKIVVGVGAGQMSRVDSVEIAVKKAGTNAANSVMASDAFFPFRDSVDLAKQAGIIAIIQPGGSNRDDEVISAANEHNISMVLTGVRHFKH